MEGREEEGATVMVEVMTVKRAAVEATTGKTRGIFITLIKEKGTPI